MINGDLTNEDAPIIAIDIDNLFIFNYKKLNFLTKLRYKFKCLSEEDKLLASTMDTRLASRINRLWDAGKFDIELITNNPDLPTIEELLVENKVSFNRLHYIPDVKERANICKLYYFYYFTDNAKIDEYKYLPCDLIHNIDLHI